MNQPSPDERELVLSALRDIAGLLDAGKCSEVIALYNTVPSRATAHERRLVSHAAAYAAFFRGLVETDLMAKIGDQIMPISRFRQEALGDSDGITLVLRDGRVGFDELPIPDRELQEKKDRLRQPTSLVDGLDSRIDRHLARLGISRAGNGRASPVLTGRMSWNDVEIEYRDEPSEIWLPLAFRDPERDARQQFWVVGDLGEGEFPLLIDANDTIPDNPIVYQGDSESSDEEPVPLCSLSTFLTRCRRP